MDAQGSELDRQERMAMFAEMANILREGNSQWVPNKWVDQGRP